MRGGFFVPLLRDGAEVCPKNCCGEDNTQACLCYKHRPTENSFDGLCIYWDGGRDRQYMEMGGTSRRQQQGGGGDDEMPGLHSGDLIN